MPDKLKKLPRIVDVVAPTYQPSKAELEEDMRVRATFEEAVEVLTRPVKVRYIPRPKRRPALSANMPETLAPRGISVGRGGENR